MAVISHFYTYSPEKFEKNQSSPVAENGVRMRTNLARKKTSLKDLEAQGWNAPETISQQRREKKKKGRSVREPNPPKGLLPSQRNVSSKIFANLRNKVGM